MKKELAKEDYENSMKKLLLHSKKTKGILDVTKQIIPCDLSMPICIELHITNVCNLMQERIAYLAARKILTEEEVRQLEPTISRAYQVAAKIRNIVLKQRFIENSAYKERVKEKLEELYLLEMCYLPEFIQILERKIEKL